MIILKLTRKIKTIRKTVIISILIILTMIFISGCVQNKKENESGALPLTGWLFSLDDNQKFFVTTAPTYKAGVVLTEQQVKEILEIEDILPTSTEINLTVEEAKNIVLNYLDKINCSQNIEVGSVGVIEYRNRNPYQIYLPIFYRVNETQTTNYGTVSVNIKGKYIAIGSIPCIEGELAYEFIIPNESSSKEILLDYLQNKTTNGNLTVINSYFMQYYAKNIEFMRSIFGETYT